MQKGIITLFIFFSFSLLAQEQSSLENLNDFRDQAGNWQIVGTVSVNRNVDVHDEPSHEEKSKKKRRKKKNTVEPVKAIEFTAGTGILLNIKG